MSVKLTEAVAPCVSVAVTLTENGLPTVVEGVPEIRPVVGFMLRLAGSPVAEKDKLRFSGSVKAAAVVVLNATPTVAICGFVIAP